MAQKSYRESEVGQRKERKPTLYGWKIKNGKGGGEKRWSGINCSSEKDWGSCLKNAKSGKALVLKKKRSGCLKKGGRNDCRARERGTEGCNGFLPEVKWGGGSGGEGGERGELHCDGHSRKREKGAKKLATGRLYKGALAPICR